MATITLDGEMLGFYDFGTNDVIINNITLPNSYPTDLKGANVHSFSVNDTITQFPPAFSAVEGNNDKFDISQANISNTSGYKWLEIRTKGKITVNGTINANGQGYVGGNPNNNGSGPYGSNNHGGYLENNSNGDPFDEKLFQDILQINDNQNWALEKNRNIVYPGSGGKGGNSSDGAAAGGAGAGGCGGGMIRLIGDLGVSFNATGLVTTQGLKDGGNGGSGNFSKGNATCKADSSPCGGTILTCSGGTWSGGWSSGSNGSRGRGQGNSSAGSPAACCDGASIGIRCWSSCSCESYTTDPKCEGVDCSGISSCCCKNRQNTSPSPTGGCSSGTAGAGGAGGGLLIRSYGFIQFNESNINLKGYNGTANGGTLKVFHTNNLSNGIIDQLEPNKADSNLDKKIGAFYNELLFSGYCPGPPIGDDGEPDKTKEAIKLLPLTAIASQYNIGEEVFNIKFDEGQAYVPNGLNVVHGGFEVYRAINYNESSNFYPDGGSKPPRKKDLPSSIYWDLVDVVPYPSSSTLGPQGIVSPSHNQQAYDSQGRKWIYSNGSDDKNPGWYLYYRDIYKFEFDDDRLYDYLIFNQSKTLLEAQNIVQDVLYSKKAIWFYVEPILYLNGTRIETDCKFDDEIKNSGAGRPETTNPNMDFLFTAVESTPFEFSPPSIDGRIVNSDVFTTDLQFDSRKYASGNFAFGFDDFKVLLSTPTYWGSFRMNNWKIDWDFVDLLNPFENYTVASVSAGTPRKLESIVNREHIYKFPTLEGRLDLRSSKNDPLGYEIVSVSAFFNSNCYELVFPQTMSNTKQLLIKEGNVAIQERPLTPIFSLSATDQPNGRGDFPAGDNFVGKYNSFYINDYLIVFNRIVSGIANDLLVDFYDESIARTFPISSWFIHYDVNDSSFNKFIPSVLSHDFADEQKLRPSIAPYDDIVIPSFTYSNPGIYYTTLVVEASGTSTGFDLSAINRLYVYPVPPTAQFTNLFSSNQETVSAFVPIFFKATDQSLDIGTSEISSWIWSVYDSVNRKYLSDIYKFYYPNNILEHNWKWHTDNYELDNITVNSALNNVCLNVYTSAFGRRGDTGIYGITGLFIDGDAPLYSNDSLCKHIHLYERPPVPQLIVTDAFTYIETFSDDNPDFEELPAFVNGSLYVSGYAPLVRVVYEDRSIPKSYPISSYLWNYDDYFNDSTNIDYLELAINSDTSGWEYPFPTNHGIDGSENYPRWITGLTEHEVEHSFTLPGVYNVTLTVFASSTSTTRTTNMSVEVIELLPSCGYKASIDKINWFDGSELFNSLSGESPLTVYFNPSGIVAGSFPIGRLIWDFGDDSEVLVVDRYVDNYNGQSFGSDPRGFNKGIIEHTYERQFLTDQSNFTVSLSVIADFSNSLIVCSSIDVGPVRLPSMSNDFHLIKNRSMELENKDLYVLQKQKDKSVYNILIPEDE